MKKYSIVALLVVTVVILGFATKPENVTKQKGQREAEAKPLVSNQQGYLETNNAQW